MISREYVKRIFFEHVGNPIELRDGALRGCCPICHEGNSYGKKARLNYYPKTGSLFCFNCQRSWNDAEWCAEVQGKEVREVLREAREYGYFYAPSIKVESTHKDELIVDELPDGAINLSSQDQLNYYGENKYITLALETIKSRRLDCCVHKLDYYISLGDKIHRNRLIIPFHDMEGHIVFYQTRRLEDDGSPKYLSKRGEKSVFGIDKVDTNLDYYYVFEGPIDSCFVQNGVALCGINFTKLQQKQLDSLFCLERIWVLDNDFHTNKDVLKKYKDLISQGERVFIWPKMLMPYKDINELCMDKQKNFVKGEFFQKFSFTNEKAFDILDKACRGEF